MNLIAPPALTKTWLDRYIQLTEGIELPSGLGRMGETTITFFESLNEEKLLFRYEQGKWTPKEILAHLIETERMFNYRALRFARKDATLLPGWNENAYALNSNANERDLSDLLEEYTSVRQSTFYLYRSFTNEMLDYQGEANGTRMSARGLLFATVGHGASPLECYSRAVRVKSLNL